MEGSTRVSSSSTRRPHRHDFVDKAGNETNRRLQEQSHWSMVLTVVRIKLRMKSAEKLKVRGGQGKIK
jgi:hypothetical protein